MPNIASALKEEISRLARKELRATTESLKKAVATDRGEIAALKRRMHTIERQVAEGRQRAGAKSAELSHDESQSLHFRPEGLKAHRQRVVAGAAGQRGDQRTDAAPLEREIGMSATAGAFNIGEAARRAGVTAKMARHYESLGLLPEIHRTDSGYLLYTDNEVHTLRFIKRSRDLGFSMAEIAQLVKLWQGPTPAKRKREEAGQRPSRRADRKIESCAPCARHSPS